MDRALYWQQSLFADAAERPAVARAEGRADAPVLSFDRLVRHQLDESSWVDHAPGWLPGHGAVFEELLAGADWRQRRRPMYDRVVDEPRMVAAWAGDDLPALPPRLALIRRALSAHYGVTFDSVLVNLYRDGRDSVAWHGDTVRRILTHPLVATVSLGHPRRFQLRRTGTSRVVRTFEPGGGDLLVMGGRTQHAWEHCVPKVPAAGARMSITLRHSQAAPTGDRAAGR